MPRGIPHLNPGRETRGLAYGACCNVLVGQFAAMKIKCIWCEKVFVVRKAGKPQKFCRIQHKRMMEAAERNYTRRLIASGEISVADIRMALPPAEEK